MSEYPIKKNVGRAPHGNTKRGLPFLKLEVGDAFEVPPEDYGRTNCARAHFQKKMRRLGTPVRISSRQVRNEKRELIAYEFKREE